MMEVRSIASAPSTPSGSSIHLSYGYAQKLNNNATLCIECGQYKRAEASLTKALKLSKLYNAYNKAREVCRCYHCTLDGCIIFTEDSHPSVIAKTHGKDSLANRSIAADHRASYSCPITPNDESSIYRRPIRVPCLPISEGHYMDHVLSLIIVFNLGLSMYLRAIEERDCKTANTKTQRLVLLKKSLQLYEVAYKFLKEYLIMGDNNGNCESYQVILCNNLYHVHRQINAYNTNGDIETATNDEDHLRMTDHQKYLEELLSALMCVLERKTHQTSSDNSDNNGDCLQRRVIHLEGFWKTVDRLVLKALCADAA